MPVPTTNPSGTPTSTPTANSNTAVPQNGNQTVDPNGPAANSNVIHVLPSSNLITYRGRFINSDPNNYLYAWPNSSMGVTFLGDSLTVDISEDGQAIYSGLPVDNYYDIAVDNQAPYAVMVAQSTANLLLASNLGAGPHTVWVHKITEAQIGTGRFSGFRTTADGAFLTPPAAGGHRIEFIGDSGVTGYGADESVTPTTMCSFTAATENADYSYPKIVADMFGADFMNLSYSGKGITANLAAQNSSQTIPLIYPYVVPDDQSTAWNFARWTADAVVIDAGGNDWTGTPGSGTAPNETLFVTTYRNFVQTIRSHYPNAAIFCVVSTAALDNDRTTMDSYLHEIVSDENNAGDPNVFYFEFPTYSPSYNYGCDYHPDLAGATANGQLLHDAIAAQLHW